MLIIPAVDIRGGKAVRLSGGDYGRETVYYDDPGDAACRWRDEGAEYLHVVDLDGAREGFPVNSKAVGEIVKRTGLPVEAGGGIRTADAVERHIDAGVDMVILGTAACSPGGLMYESVEKHGRKIAVSLDVRNGKAAVCGWLKPAGKGVPELLGEFEKAGVENLVYTDITRDGLLKGVHIESVREVAEATPLRVTVAGGVTSLDDIKALAGLDIRGFIAGKALYAGRINLREAMECLKK